MTETTAAIGITRKIVVWMSVVPHHRVSRIGGTTIQNKLLVCLVVLVHRVEL